MLQQQVDEKNRQKATLKATISSETQQREQYNSTKLNQPLAPSRRQPQEAAASNGMGRNPSGPSYFEEAPAQGNGFQSRPEQYPADQGSYTDDAEFQRRLAEYKEEELAALEAKLAQQNGYGNSSGYGDNSNANGSEAYEGYKRGDDFPNYQRSEEVPAYQRGEDYGAYQRQEDYAAPHQPQSSMNNNYNDQKPEVIKNAVQRNYLVNNPLVPDVQAQRNQPTQGFRAHQDIKHNQMNVPRGQKGNGMYGVSAQEAYTNIKNKYGNHSAQYNILTGN